MGSAPSNPLPDVSTRIVLCEPNGKPQRRLSRGWQVAAILAALLAVGVGTWNAIVATSNAKAAAQNAAVAESSAARAWRAFRYETRPWPRILVTPISGPGDGWFVAKYRVTNVGKGIAAWVFPRIAQVNTRGPVADLAIVGLKERPAVAVFPGDTVDVLAGAEPLLKGCRGRPDVFYVHTMLAYGGTATQDTFYIEDVWYVNTGYAPEKSRQAAPWVGSEQLYYGEVSNGMVRLSNGVAVDAAARAHARELLESMSLADLAAVKGRLVAAYEALCQAGCDTTVAEHAAALYEHRWRTGSSRAVRFVPGLVRHVERMMTR